MKTKTYRPKTCDLCGFKYTPTGAKQRWCKTCIPNAEAESRWWNRGMSDPAFQAMLRGQNNRCAICSCELGTGHLRHIDHDHVTGQIRGILCNKCNRALHHVENADWLNKALRYLA